MQNIVSFGTALRRHAFKASLGLGLVLGSCNVLDYTTQDAISETAVFTDPARIALAVTGVYDAAQSGFYNGNTSAAGVRGYPFGAASTDLGDARGEDVSDMAGFFGIVFTNSITISSPNIVYMWANCYAVINKANAVIAGIQQAQAAGVITAAQEASYEGEMRFLRALAHMELVINFSKPYTDGAGNNPGVPYRDTPITTATAITSAGNVDRGTVANVYAKMLADLDYAETNLAAAAVIKTTVTASAAIGKTRATKGAAIALKQRLRLYQGNWDATIAEGNKLISGSGTYTSPISGYQLAPTQRDAFAGSAASVENIFSIENTATDNPGVNGAVANVFGSSASAPTGIAGRSLLGVSPNLYNASFFTCNDLRRTQMMQQDGVRTCYVLKKYLDAASSSDYNPIIRYAEVLLNQAEALSRNGQGTQALALLNAVRNRSVATADQYTSANAPTGTALTQAILNERRIEFVGEGLRWGDIARLAKDANFAPVSGGGIPAKYNGQVSGQVVLSRYSCGGATTGQSVAAVPYSGAASSPLFLWPIPSSETSLNPTLAAQQNPGY